LQNQITTNSTDLSNHISDSLIHQEVVQRVEGGRASSNTTNQYLRSDDSNQLWEL